MEREQALALTKNQELVGHLTNEDPTPIKNITPDSNNSTNLDIFASKLTEEYVVQQKADCLLLGWIIGLLLKETPSLAMGLDTSYAIQNSPKNEYAHDSQEHEFTLKQRVTYLRKKDGRTIREHICTFKGLCDNFAAIKNLVLN